MEREFISERKNILILTVLAVIAVAVILFSPLCPDSLKSQEKLEQEFLKSLESGAGDASLSDSSSAALNAGKKNIPESAILYCEWSWPQKIINKETKEVYWTCPSSRPYCKAGTTECCEYNEDTKAHFNCYDMNQ